MRTHHVGHSVLLDYEGEWVDSCPERPRHPKGVKFTDKHWLQENLLLPERWHKVLCARLQPRGTCSFSWRMVTFQAKGYRTRECRHREGQMAPPDQGHALRSLKGYGMFWQREPCADLLVWVLVQSPTHYVALGYSCVSEQLQEGVGNDGLASLTRLPESAK